MSLKQKFKGTSKDTHQAVTPTFSGPYKVTPRKWENGSNKLRLLPQPADSEYNNYLSYGSIIIEGHGPITTGLNILNIYSKTGPSCHLILNEEGATELERAKWALWKSDYKGLLQSKDNKLGLKFDPSPKVIFLGYDITDTNALIQPIILPGTRRPYGDKAPRIGAGSRVVSFCTATDINGKEKYGDIFDVEVGQAIDIQVSNAGTMEAAYTPDPAGVYPVPDSVLEKIKPFDTYITFSGKAEVRDWLKEYLPEEAYNFLYENSNEPF